MSLSSPRNTSTTCSVSLSYVLSCCDQYGFMYLHGFLFGIEELLVDNQLAHTEGSLPISFGPIARAGSKFQNMDLEIPVFGKPRLLVLRTFDENPRGMPHPSAIILCLVNKHPSSLCFRHCIGKFFQWSPMSTFTYCPIMKAQHPCKSASTCHFCRHHRACFSTGQITC